ncbi:hypothetical protein KA005_20755 [bacterium]|nr:hypothetical protein [bacterium]
MSNAIEIVIDNAWKRHQRIMSLMQQWRLYTLELGKELYEMRESGDWQKLGDYEHYSGYLDDYGIQRTFASEVTKIYEVYQLGLGIRYTELLDISYPKLYSAAKYADEKTVTEILASAATQNLHKFRRWLKERFRPHKEELPAIQANDYEGDDWRLLYGDMRERCLEFKDKSFDAIVTDPPYPGEYLPLFESLAQVASRLLVSSGTMLVMSGQTHLPEVLRLMTKHITYRWTIAYLTPGKETRIWGRQIWAHWKPVLVFSKDGLIGDWAVDVVTSPAPDKEYHYWGQSLQGMRGLVDAFVLPSSRILDPFCGGGATIDAALDLGHECVGIDNDAQAILAIRERLNDKQKKR